MSYTEKVEYSKEYVVRLAETVVNVAIEELNKENESDYSYNLRSVDVVVNDNGTMTIDISVEFTVHFYEISEAVANTLEQSLAENKEELSEEELEKMFEEAYNNQLKEINDEYMIPLELEAKLDLSSYYIRGGELKVKATPLNCVEDDCDVGLQIDIKLENIPIKIFEETASEIKNSIKRVISKVSDFHTL